MIILLSIFLHIQINYFNNYIKCILFDFDLLKIFFNNINNNFISLVFYTKKTQKNRRTKRKAKFKNIKKKTVSDNDCIVIF